MKKVQFLPVVLLTGMLIYSCQKEQPIDVVSPDSNSGVTVRNNLLVFKTSDDYCNLVDNASSEQMFNFVNEVKSMKNFTSYYENAILFSKVPSVLSDSNFINDEFLQTILNKDGAVQIGNYIYKIDVNNEKVFVLNAENASQYSDVVEGDTSNTNVRAFSVNDEVISLVENKNRTREGGIGSYSSSAKLIIINLYREVRGFKYLNIAFSRYGILFQLIQSNSKTTWIGSPSTCGFRANYFKLKFKIRNRGECDESRSYLLYDIGNSRKIYSGSKTLSKLWVQGQIEEILKGQVVSSSMLIPEIRVNY